MITRSEALKFLRSLVVALSLVEEILVIVPDYASLIRNVKLFRDFLKGLHHEP